MDKLRSFPQGEIFHLCNKSISNYSIFRNENWIDRFLTAIHHYNDINIQVCLSKALRKPIVQQNLLVRKPNQILYVLAYCIMRDHYHLLVKVHKDYSLSRCISNIENSYTRYYNKLNRGKGPLWQSRFRASSIKDNETLLHVHRYIHLNPVTAGYVNKPEEWKWSSYITFISNSEALLNTKEISIKSVHTYKRFIEDQINYQKTIKGIQRKLLE